MYVVQKLLSGERVGRVIEQGAIGTLNIPFICFWFGGILGSASGAEFPVSLSNHIGFTPRLLYSSTDHSPEGFIHLKTG